MSDHCLWLERLESVALENDTRFLRNLAMDGWMNLWMSRPCRQGRNEKTKYHSLQGRAGNLPYVTQSDPVRSHQRCINMSFTYSLTLSLTHLTRCCCEDLTNVGKRRWYALMMLDSHSTQLYSNQLYSVLTNSSAPFRSTIPSIIALPKITLITSSSIYHHNPYQRFISYESCLCFRVPLLLLF